jgi:hypothetical protein
MGNCLWVQSLSFARWKEFWKWMLVMVAQQCYVLSIMQCMLKNCLYGKFSFMCILSQLKKKVWSLCCPAFGWSHTGGSGRWEALHRSVGEKGIKDQVLGHCERSTWSQQFSELWPGMKQTSAVPSSCQKVLLRSEAGVKGLCVTQSGITQHWEWPILHLHLETN